MWEVRNGEEAEEIRKKYKEAGRSTSYWAFYNDLNELLKENDIEIQLEVSDGGTTDGTAIHLNRDGIITGKAK